MAGRNSATELEEKLSLLSQNFFQELRKIAEQRMKLQMERVSSVKDKLLAKGKLDRKVREIKKPVPETFTVRLEPSLGESLFQSRETADKLDETLEETRTTFGDKVVTVDRVKAEIERRENVLVRSTRQIEAYLRTVFYFKQEADDLRIQLLRSAEMKSTILKQMEQDLNTWKNKKLLLSKVINAFQSAKFLLEKMFLALQPDYATFSDFVQYYLVLETFKEDLLAIDLKRTQDEEELAKDKQKIAEFKRRVPVIVTSKESTILNLKSELKNLKVETTQLEEQIDAATISRAKDDAAWYEFQNWIRRMFLDSIEIRPPEAAKPIAGTLNMLDRMKDFVEDAFQLVERLKEEAGTPR